ncbi:MAG: ATP-binding protein [Novosphingobium sp.]|nr:ATP-binding protein [Novosphingobium sp.]
MNIRKLRIGPPRSMLGQMMLAVALALLLAQGLGTALVYRAQAERRDEAMIHAAAFRLLAATRGENTVMRRQPQGPFHVRGMRVEYSTAAPLRAGETRDTDAEAALRQFLVQENGGPVPEVVVLQRKVADDAYARDRLARRFPRHGPSPADNAENPRPVRVMVAGLHDPQSGRWMVARVFVPGGGKQFLTSLLAQTLLIYIVLMGAIALILRRITRPLATLRDRLDAFSHDPGSPDKLEPKGPDDVRHLIEAHNAMEARISALLDEKDVMLGAIGHDLKTPLAALRVRIESVEDDAERERMATTIEDIVRTLDDILSLARVGRPSDPLEQSELSALVASVVEEYEDMGEPVTLEETLRVALPLRATWLRRAVRNVIGNALRYGKVARVGVGREGNRAVIRIDDDGPGIADADIGRMLEPFTRGDPSRNTETGGAGLGLTLARAIAEQHGGSLRLENRRGPGGEVEGLAATISLPLP